MDLQKAIEIVGYYQQWRLGKKKEMIEPRKITEALNILLREVKKTNSRKNL